MTTKTVYAISTANGYLGAQGRSHWFQDEPKGWAVFSTEEHARSVAEAHRSAIDKNSDKGYEIVQVPYKG